MSKKFKVYAIDIDGQAYVGSTNDMKRRLKDHRCRCFRPNSKHYNCKFYNYIRNKYTKEEAYEKINKGHKILCIVDTKEEAIEMEQEYISTIGILNGRMEINTIINSERCKNYRNKNLEESRNREAAYRQSEKGKANRKAYREKNKERQKERVVCEKCGHESTRKHISDHRRKGLCN
jgi:predicted GIY-YIG superfamily endonuclease